MITQLTMTDQLNVLIEESHANDLFLFKHSNRCGISAVAFAAFKFFADKHPEVSCAYLVLQEDNEISRLLTELSGISHQSPQVIQYSFGQPVWSTSHHAITAEALEARL